jgi:hypothetical protein
MTNERKATGGKLVENLQQRIHGELEGEWINNGELMDRAWSANGKHGEII